MSDTKQKSASEEFALDDILKEVASWDAPPGQVTDPPAASPETPPVAVEETPPVTEASADAPEAGTEPPEPTDGEASPVAQEGETDEASEGTDPTGQPVVVELPLPPPDEDEEDEPSDPDAPPPDNLIPFQVPVQAQEPPQEVAPPPTGGSRTKKKKPPKEPEPETVRELVILLAGKSNAWLRTQKKKFNPRHRKRTAEAKAQAKAERRAAQGKHVRKGFLASPLPPPPDAPAKELSIQYGRQLGPLKLRCMGLGFCGFLLLLLTLLEQTKALPLPEALREPSLLVWISFAILLPALVLAGPLIGKGVLDLFRGRIGLHTFVPLAVLALLTDILTFQFLHLRPYSPPLVLPLVLLLFVQMLGLYFKTSTLRQTCRTAASASAPDLMTAEPSQWNGKPVYRRRFGSMNGFGSQVQAEDGAEQRFRTLGPLLLVAAILLPCVPLLFKHNPRLIPWALSATLCAAGTLSGTLCFALPYRKLCRRLSSLGVALAGWSGITTAQTGTGLLVEDTDLFPPGAVEVKSFRVFSNFPVEQVMSVTSSLLRAVGSGLDPVFYSLMRSEGGALVTATQVSLDSEGISAHVAGAPVLVGSYNYLARQGISMPEGVRVKTGVFCAIETRFAGQFILEYSMHKSAATAMDVLLGSHVTPVLIGLDFNLVPTVLKQLFRFPWEKMAFPDISQRAKLRTAPIPRETKLMAALCLYGLPSVAEAAVGAQRLYLAVRVCSVFTLLGAFVGVLITAVLAIAAATTSLSPLGLSLFLLSWLLPTMLVSGWVNQF